MDMRADRADEISDFCVFGILRRKSEAVCSRSEASYIEICEPTERRNSFYNFYTNRIRGSVENYNLAIDTAQVGIKNAAEIIADYVKKLT